MIMHSERERHLRRHAVLVRISLLSRHFTNGGEESHAKNRKDYLDKGLPMRPFGLRPQGNQIRD
jgi:hypothetical protein